MNLRNYLSLCLGAAAVLAFAKAPDLPGTWLLNGTDGSTRWVFKKDGSFNFVSSMASSKGRWKLESGQIRLIWTEIDRQKPKGTVQGVYPMLPDGSFQVDRFNYRRKG